MRGKGRAAQLSPVKNGQITLQTEKREGWAWWQRSNALAFVKSAIRTTKSRSLWITQWNCLEEQTRKRKWQMGAELEKKFHLKWATATHVRSHETQRRYNCIQNCLCGFETRNRTFSKRSKKLRFPIRKALAGWRSVWRCYAASGARLRKRRTCQISNVTSSASRPWAHVTSISSLLFV